MTINNNGAHLAQKAIVSFLDLKKFVDWLYDYYTFDEEMWGVKNAHLLTPDFETLKQEMSSRPAAITPAPHARRIAAHALQSLLRPAHHKRRYLLTEVETLVRAGQWQESVQKVEQMKRSASRILAYIAILPEPEESSDSA